MYICRIVAALTLLLAKERSIFNKLGFTDKPVKRE